MPIPETLAVAGTVLYRSIPAPIQQAVFLLEAAALVAAGHRLDSAWKGVGVTIKKFEKGQTAYILGDGRRRAEGKATAVEVIKVGRKYVTVKEAGRQETRFCEAFGLADCLIEDKNYGVQRLLFATTEAVDDYNELNDLRNWVQEATNWMKVKDYTLAQLREVKRILEGGASGET